jgi:hypothetical protein
MAQRCLAAGIDDRRDGALQPSLPVEGAIRDCDDFGHGLPLSQHELAAV